MTVVINGDTGISPVTASGTSALVDGMTVGRGGGEVSTNTAVGASALTSNTSGTSNTAVGYQATYSNTTGTPLTALGYQAGYLNTIGNSNVIIGSQAGYTNSTGSNSTYIGTQSGFSATGSYNTALGFASGYSLTTGTGNTFVGASGSTVASGYYVTTGSKNTILGAYTGNQGGLDIRTASNYIVLSDGDGNPRQVINGSGAVSFNGTSTGTTGQVLTSAGSGSAPTWATPATGALVFISSATASSSASLAFTSIGSTYDAYVFELVNVRPATDATTLYLRTSANNGVSYDSGATNYSYSASSLIVAGGQSYQNNGSDSASSAIVLTRPSVVGNATNEFGVSGFVYLWNPAATAYCRSTFQTNYADVNTQFQWANGMGIRISAAAVNAVQFLFDSGNIVTGTIRMYGIANS